MKIRILEQSGTITLPNEFRPGRTEVKDPAIEILKSLNFEIKKLLGEGKFGKVYSASMPDGGEAAVKIISPDVPGGDASINKELSNYFTIQKAREQSELVAKHFPEVYGRPFKKDGYGFIVMEVLTPGGDESLEIQDLFAGPEGAIEPYQDLVTYGVYKDFSRRLFSFFDDTNRRNAFVDRLFRGLDVENIQDETTRNMLIGVKSEMKSLADLWRGIFDATQTEEGKRKYVKQVYSMESVIPFQHQSLVMDFDTKKELIDNVWLYYIFLQMLEVFKNADDYIYEIYVGTIVENFMNFIRKDSPIPIHNRPEQRRADRGGASREMAGVSKQAESLLAAIDEAEQLTGLAARDMHDKNAMFRPLGGDIVIVDLGLFKPRSQVKEGKRWSKKQRNKRKKSCANPKGFTMKQFCKNQKTKSKKGERKNEGLDRKTITIKIRKNLEERCQKGYKTHPTRKTKKMFGRRYRNCVKAEGQVEEKKLTDAEKRKKGEIKKAIKRDNPDMDKSKMIAIATDTAIRVAERKKKRDPKKGTGKKPKGSGRRLYTDEDPSDTVSVSFKSVSAIKKTLAKPSFKSKSHKRQSQIINLIHQRSRAAYKNAKDPKVKARLKKAYDYAKKRKEASKKKTIRMRKNKK